MSPDWAWQVRRGDAEAWADALPAAPDLDDHDWRFRARFATEPAAAGEEIVLAFDGIATVADVLLDGEPLLHSDSMFAAHEVDVTARLGDGEHELEIVCRALTPLLARPRRPRARWRTKLADNGLRWWRTMLLGRMPGVAEGPPVVGPWRPVRLVRRSGVVAEDVRVRPRLDGDAGRLEVAARLRGVAGAAVPGHVTLTLDGPSGTHAVELPVGPEGVVGGTLVVPDVARWWPHTHGEPVLHEVALRAGAVALWSGHAGFRTLTSGRDLETAGLALVVNDVPVFARGAVWTPAPDALRGGLERLRDAGMNLVRVVGTAAYEEPAFHDLCDELGILVWQDLMFANHDHPFADETFAAAVEAEVESVLAGLAGRPSFAVLCGNSEVEQQVAMLGLDPALGRGPFFGERVPELLAASGADARYVPSAPCGGVLPMRADAGVANWFGVGGYRRPLEETRRAGVRFASECLAFSNLPDAALTDRVGLDAGVPRDAGAPWDFADVRDHYLELLYRVDARDLRRDDPSRYAELSRAVTGEAMAAVLGEWRRTASPCAGAIVLWLRDLVPGAGWGLLDAEGRPKLAWHHVRRALAPVAVWITDEGLDGLRVHVAGDGPEPLDATLELALHRDGELCVDRADTALHVGPHTVVEIDAEAVLGRFADVAYAHRFGPPGHDLVVATLTGADGALLAQAFHHPLGLPASTEPVERLGLRVQADGPRTVTVASRRLAYGVRVWAPGHEPADDGFTIAPGGARTIELRPVTADASAAPPVSVSALNARGHVTAVVPVEVHA